MTTRETCCLLSVKYSYFGWALNCALLFRGTAFVGVRAHVNCLTWTVSFNTTTFQAYQSRFASFLDPTFPAILPSFLFSLRSVGQGVWPFTIQLSNLDAKRCIRFVCGCGSGGGAGRETLIESGRLRNGARRQSWLTKLIDDWMGLKSQKSISWSKRRRAQRGRKAFKVAGEVFRRAAATLRGCRHRWQVAKCPSSIWLAASICIFIATRSPDQTGGRMFLKAPRCLQQGH